MEDERYFAGEWSVRGLTYRTKREGKPPKALVRMCEVAATPRALYVFSASAGDIDGDTRESIRRIVGSLEIVARGE